LTSWSSVVVDRVATTKVVVVGPVYSSRKATTPCLETSLQEKLRSRSVREAQLGLSPQEQVTTVEAPDLGASSPPGVEKVVTPIRPTPAVMTATMAGRAVVAQVNLWVQLITEEIPVSRATMLTRNPATPMANMEALEEMAGVRALVEPEVEVVEPEVRVPTRRQDKQETVVPARPVP
jgi:hypothetical protein